LVEVGFRCAEVRISNAHMLKAQINTQLFNAIGNSLPVWLIIRFGHPGIVTV